MRKERIHPDTKEILVKVRIILDCKKSGVSLAAARSHRSPLPRVLDAVRAALGQMPLGPEEGFDQLVADIVDAFWLIPLRHSERKFFVGS